MIIQLPITSDKHVGSSLGLSPLAFQKQDGGTYMANPVQKWLHKKWIDYWDQVRKRKEWLQKTFPGEEILTIHANVGDDPDKDKRGIERTSNNPSEILTLLSSLLDETNDVVDYEVFIRGTSVHNGVEGWMSEETGKDRDRTIKNPETNTFSWWYYKLELEGVKVDFYHKPETTGTRPWTEDLAPVRQSEIIRSRCGRVGEEIPDYSFYGHHHLYTRSAPHIKPVVVYLPSWQAPYEWIHNIGRGQYKRPIGGVMLEVREGKGELFEYLYQPRSSKRWTLKDLER